MSHSKLNILIFLSFIFCSFSFLFHFKQFVLLSSKVLAYIKNIQSYFLYMCIHYHSIYHVQVVGIISKIVKKKTREHTSKNDSFSFQRKPKRQKESSPTKERNKINKKKMGTFLVYELK